MKRVEWTNKANARLLVRLVVCTASIAAAPAALAVNLQTTDSSDCKVTRLFSDKETVSWSGECREGLAHGRGVAEWTVTMGARTLINRYEGSMRAGAPHGLGEMKYHRGEIYDGAWRRGERHGKGVVIEDDGGRFDGVWRNDAIHGAGVYTTSDGQRRSGQWRRGAHIGSWYSDPTGNCRLWWTPGPRDWLFPTGSLSWSQPCRRGRAHGSGALTWKAGPGAPGTSVEFEGVLKHGKFHGSGTWSLSDGVGTEDEATQTYKGEFRAGERRGEGEWTLNEKYSGGNGGLEESYKGDWRRNVRHGEGVFQRSHSDPPAKTNETERYEGAWRRDQKHGRGEYTHTQFHLDDEGATAGSIKITYSGEWRNDKRHGEGIHHEYWRTGDGEHSRKYDGEWREGIRHGRGMMRYENGGTFTGGWDKNTPTEGVCDFPADNYNGQCKLVDGPSWR